MKKKANPRVLDSSWSGEAEKSCPSGRTDYISSLKTQCMVRYDALKTAENLIAAYQKDNELLREENQQLKEQLAVSDSQFQEREKYEQQIDKLERTLLKYSQKINHLLEKGMQDEHRIHELQREVDALRAREPQESRKQSFRKPERRTADSKCKTSFKPSREERDEREEREEEMPHGHTVSKAAMLGASRSMNGEAQDKQVLEWKLQQKDEEVLLLLRRQRGLEEKF